MCIGLPMRVLQGDEIEARCERRGLVHTISMLLIGAQPSGAYVLTHLGSAIRALEEAEARLIDDALEGLALAAEGANADAQFADLVGREPELPVHLRGETI